MLLQYFGLLLFVFRVLKCYRVRELVSCLCSFCVEVYRLLRFVFSVCLCYRAPMRTLVFILTDIEL